jgi:hypothetical protein
MQMRIIHVGAAIAAIVLALTVARTDALAASDKESCSTTSTDVTHLNADTTEAICDAAIGPPNKATAHASDLGKAEAVGQNMGTATAHAKGTGSEALAAGTVGGKGTATAKNGGTAQAESDGGTAAASSSGLGTALSFAAPSGKAKATARNTGTSFGAEAAAEAACKATANSNGAGSLAFAECTIGGSSVSAHATRGSTAAGSDIAPPTCTPMNGGIAKVRSPMGNCG